MECGSKAAALQMGTINLAHFRMARTGLGPATAKAKAPI